MEVLPISYDYTNEMSPEMDLLAAASIGDLGLVHRLLQQGANVDLQNESGWTPLMYAAHYGHYNVVKMLIDYGANVNITEKIQGRTPLMLAASCGHTRCIEVLITLGAADIDMTDTQGHNAAYYAIHSGHGRNKIIAKLLKIQGKSRSSSSTNATSSTSTSSSLVSSASRTRPLTKGRSDASPANGNSNGNNNANNNNNSYSKHASNRGQNVTISSNKITSTTKPDIIISQENIRPIIEDSSPFSNGNGNNKKNDDSSTCDYYSPYLSLNREWSPLGGRQFTPSSPSSPFCINNGFTPQLTIDGLMGKRRLPMSEQNDCSRSESRSPLPENLDSLLKRIGLPQYSQLFNSHGIDLYCFLTLNEADFEKIGITLLGHKQKLYMAQLRFRESVEIASTQEQFLADWLLSERENLKKENHELKMKLKGVETANNLMPLYN